MRGVRVHTYKLTSKDHYYYGFCIYCLLRVEIKRASWRHENNLMFFIVQCKLKIRAQLFKTNDVVSKRIFKTLIIKYEGCSK